MKEYNIEAIIWEDHLKVDRGTLPKRPSDVIQTTLSFGVVVNESDKAIILVSDIERYDDRDDCSYLILFKSTILSRKKYGSIKIRKIRR